MSAIEKRNAMKFERRFNEYDKTKIWRDVADFEDLDEGIVPLSQFMDYLAAIIEEAGDDKDSLFLRAREPSDCWIMGLSVVLFKDKTAEEIAAMQEFEDKRKEADALATERQNKALFLKLKAKYEPE